MALLAAAAAIAIAADGSHSRNANRAAVQAAGPAPAALLDSLRPAAAPASWRAATIASGMATLRYPAGWARIEGDAGTVSATLRAPDGHYLGYLNVTPRQGAERLRGWAAFRIDRNREEGDGHVRELALRAGVPFGLARGSCLVDEYTSRVGANPYRELACIVRGRHAESVIVAAALRSRWAQLAPVLARSVAALDER